MAFLDWFKGAKVPSSWFSLNEMDQLDHAIDRSYKKDVAFIKHSTRCGISHAVLSHLIEESQERPSDIELYYLDLIKYREISNEISKRLNVTHQSPQFIMLRKGNVVYKSSHHGIKWEDILAQ